MKMWSRGLGKENLSLEFDVATVRTLEEALENFAEVWEEKYPTIVKQWRLRWPEIIPLFEFPPAIRKAIYTTNVIESVNSVIRKFTRNRKHALALRVVAGNPDHIPLLLGIWVE